MKMKNSQATLLVVALAVFFGMSAVAGELAPIDAKDFPLTANMKRAHKVEILDVKTQPDTLVLVSARLTFANGSKVDCEYVMSTKIVQIGQRSGIQFLPKSEKCASPAR